MGFNRLSIGVQSPERRRARAAGPPALGGGAPLDALRDARDSGFENVNADLIFGLIEQPLSRWQETLESMLSVQPEHLSCYALTIEPGTHLYYRVQKGELPEPDPDVVADQYEWTRDRLARAGYEQYEISNWARPGLSCRHNLVYWRAQPYLGIGAGAHSFFAGPAPRERRLARPLRRSRSTPRTRSANGTGAASCSRSPAARRRTR